MFTQCYMYTNIQVLSKSVADTLRFFGDDATSETEVFAWNFDRFFDCLTVRSLTAWRAKRKPDLKPYNSPDDSRLKVFNYYLPYIPSISSISGLKMTSFPTLIIGNPL